mmetsp:Transcript_40730/g.49577  ORF Transcript_40730/g.49577 Transcript_40730/m.49577 type:complete len:180 (+) Transcript_40730:99-638(+)
METTDFCPTYSIDAISCRDIPYKSRIPAFKNVKGESYSANARCFLTDSVRPICLDVKCVEQNFTALVTAAGKEFLCTEDYQKFELPGVVNGSGVFFECPRIAAICPEMVCPANCAGHGVCDYSKKNPECKCFNANDKSPGCTDIVELVPPKVSWEENYAVKMYYFGTLFSPLLLFVMLM